MGITKIMQVVAPKRTPTPYWELQGSKRLYEAHSSHFRGYL